MASIVFVKIGIGKNEGMSDKIEKKSSDKIEKMSDKIDAVTNGNEKTRNDNMEKI